jgi:P27 family predicted phage terminase small subunit
MRCPSWLKGHARQFWKRIAPQLQAAGILTELDLEGLAALALAYATMRQAGDDLLRQGFCVDDARQSIKKNPSFSVYSTSVDAFRRLGEQFGLFPKARQTMDIQQPKPLNTLQEYANLRGQKHE